MDKWMITWTKTDYLGSGVAIGLIAGSMLMIMAFLLSGEGCLF